VPGVRILFALGARLGKTAAEIERLSLREVLAWVEFFESAGAPDADADALDPRTASRADLRAAFAK
jgi:hypothetical protein